MVASEAEKAKIEVGPSQLQSPLRPGGHRDLRSLFGPEAISFVSRSELGRRIGAETGERRSLQFLLQGFSVAIYIQRGSGVAVMGTSPPLDNVFI